MMNNQFTRNIIIWVAIFMVLILGFNVMQNSYFSEPRTKLPLSELLTKVENKEVIKVRLQGRNAEGQLTDGTYFSTYTGDYPRLVDRLYDNGITIDIVPIDTKMNSILSILISWFPMILLIGVWVFFMRQMNSGGGRAFGFGKSKAKLVSDKSPKVTFKDVAGIEEAKEELMEIVDFLRDPGKFQQLGGRIPKGCLLIGPPGTGKTLLARAIAGEANVPFFSLSGSDFVEMFVGVGASRVRDMFEQGKKNAPCIIFIDEIDAVGRHRGVGLGGGNDEREQTLNQMLVEMDGFDTNEGIVIIAATNRPDVLDHALLRPGRFDRQITVPNPDVRGREQILRVHLQKVKVDSKVDARVLARGTPGLSGAELANLVNEAALLAARKGKKVVDNEDLELAKDKVLMGPERKSMVMSDKEKELTAYHEAGHAIVGLYVPNPEPIHKATIVPRGPALGMVMRLPEGDRLSISRNKVRSDIAVAMGGLVAEEMIFGEGNVTSGASGDIKGATELARAMVTEGGMSEKLGPVYYGREQSIYSKGSNNHSNYIDELIDKEVYKLINQGYETAKQILSAHLESMHKLAKALQEKETLTGDEIKELLKLPPDLKVES